MLVAEDSEMKRAGDGKFYRAFTCDEGVRNEALDGRVGTMAIERIVKPNYARLSAEFSIETREPEDPPAAIESPKGKKSKGGFVGRFLPTTRRGKGFIRGW
jgi:hypothetical protein